MVDFNDSHVLKINLPKKLVHLIDLFLESLVKLVESLCFELRVCLALLEDVE
jgi:hypothetical protein